MWYLCEFQTHKPITLRNHLLTSYPDLTNDFKRGLKIANACALSEEENPI